MRALFMALLLIAVETQALPLFKLEYEGHTSYILGTHHVLHMSVLPQAVGQMIRESRVVLVESEFSAADDPQAIEDFRRRGYDPGFDNQPLFDPQDRLKIKFLVESSQAYSMQVFTHLRPPAAFQVLNQLFHRQEKARLRQLILDHIEYLQRSEQLSAKAVEALLHVALSFREPLMDEALARAARQNAVPVLSLDTESYFEMCMKAVNSVNLGKFVHRKLESLSQSPIPYQRQPSAFWSPLVTKERFINWIPSEDLSLWLTPDLDPVEQYAIGRHSAWMTRIISELQRGGAFIAVGLLHVTGDDSTDGLITMLSQSGVKVSFVSDCESLLSAKSLKEL